MIYLFLLGRILVGGYFIMSGYNHFKNRGMLSGYAESKGVPMASFSVWLSGAMMLLGGLGVLLGVYVTYSIYLLVIFLLVAALKMHQFWKISDPGARMTEEINFKKNLALAGALLMLLAIQLPWELTFSLF